ncbi:MAG: winged helix-turn-helix transcriptional regulator [Anaerolineales bacterium]|nr:winged helix-turn-helix transcriptional regulator [Anaerolineales bacterium]
MVDQLFNYNEAVIQADRCRALAHPRRILILWSLSNGEKTVGEIAELIDSSIQNTSHHLRLMKEKKILMSNRQGQSVYYQIADPENLRLILQIADSGSNKTMK